MNKDVVVLLSGGLDSFVAYHYAKHEGINPLALWLDIGQPYARKEEEAIDSFDFSVRKIRMNLLQHEWGNMPTPEQQIIPARNLLFTVIGSMFGGRVWVSALHGEQHGREHDKSERYFKDTSALLTYVLDYLREETLVETPFAHLSKTEVVAWALSHGIPASALLKTSTCYDEQIRNCGRCGTCFKRWIAMTNNGISENYASPPWLCDYAKSTIDGMREAVREKDYSRFTQKRCQETFSALLTQVS